MVTNDHSLMGAMTYTGESSPWHSAQHLRLSATRSRSSPEPYTYQANKENLDGRRKKYHEDDTRQEDQKDLDGPPVAVSVLEPGADKDTTASQGLMKQVNTVDPQNVPHNRGFGDGGLPSRSELITFRSWCAVLLAKGRKTCDTGEHCDVSTLYKSRGFVRVCI